MDPSAGSIRSVLDPWLPRIYPPRYFSCRKIRWFFSSIVSLRIQESSERREERSWSWYSRIRKIPLGSVKSWISASSCRYRVNWELHEITLGPWGPYNRHGVLKDRMEIAGQKESPAGLTVDTFLPKYSRIIQFLKIKRSDRRESFYRSCWMELTHQGILLRYDRYRGSRHWSCEVVKSPISCRRRVLTNQMQLNGFKQLAAAVFRFLTDRQTAPNPLLDTDDFTIILSKDYCSWIQWFISALLFSLVFYGTRPTLLLLLPLLLCSSYQLISVG